MERRIGAVAVAAIIVASGVVGAEIDSQQVAGTVMSIDRTENRMRVRDSQGDILEFRMAEGTRVVNEGSVADIRPGDNVVIRQDLRGEQIEQIRLSPDAQ